MTVVPRRFRDGSPQAVLATAASTGRAMVRTKAGQAVYVLSKASGEKYARRVRVRYVASGRVRSVNIEDLDLATLTVLPKDPT